MKASSQRLQENQFHLKLMNQPLNIKKVLIMLAITIFKKAAQIFLIIMDGKI